MILTDTGPIVALLDVDDQYHAACFAAARRLPSEPLLTTLPCFTEAMYFLGRSGGHHYQSLLWNLYSEGRIVLHQLTGAEMARMTELMAQYRDTPMGLADASLVVVAESRSLRLVFTVDRQFYIYRLNDGSALDVVP